ncbi:MAG: uracil-DNA glycosylase family protein [Tannerella sp.]|nr:uracil-DNA glycosylase family protein [Tannerella sp.]
MDVKEILTEQHPLEPFLPDGTRLLMLGSFPPQRKRWSMEFYYPNLNNDFWRIMGMIFYGDRARFLTTSGRAFCRETIVEFLTAKQIALYDTATQIRRLNDNASDKYLEVVVPTNIKALLRRIPDCRAIASTGQKATDIIAEQFGIASPPPIGEHAEVVHEGRMLEIWRMPSSSRAYPLKLESKAEIYGRMFRKLRYNQTK